jgi:hypothetical protein
VFFLQAAFFLQKGAPAVIRCQRFQAVAERTVWSAAIAQLVEHVIRNDGVTGSSPVCGTIQIIETANRIAVSLVRLAEADVTITCRDVRTCARVLIERTRAEAI